MQCSAQHQAVRHHTISTDGAARHAGCSGPTRPCVTARRRRQGSVGQVRECTGPAMPQHIYTQRAHNTHSPARLPVPVGRHPGLCLLVTAPSAHHTTPHHTTPHHTTHPQFPCTGGRKMATLRKPSPATRPHGGDQWAKCITRVEYWDRASRGRNIVKDISTTNEVRTRKWMRAAQKGLKMSCIHPFVQHN